MFRCSFGKYGREFLDHWWWPYKGRNASGSNQNIVIKVSWKINTVLISWPAEWLLVSQKPLCSIELTASERKFSMACRPVHIPFHTSLSIPVISTSAVESGDRQTDERTYTHTHTHTRSISSEELFTPLRNLPPPPVALLPWRGGSACVPQWSWGRCQPELPLLTGVSMLVRGKGRGQTKADAGMSGC
jgi:hypothetical protein